MPPTLKKYPVSHPFSPSLSVSLSHYQGISRIYNNAINNTFLQQHAAVKKDKDHMKDHLYCAVNTWYWLIIKCTRQFKAISDDLHNYVSEI